MINNISEGALRTVTKIDPGGAIHDKEAAQQQAEVARQERPVEDTESGNKANGKDAGQKDRSKYVVDGHTVVFEKYDEKGDLVFRLPPSYKPVDERA